MGYSMGKKRGKVQKVDGRRVKVKKKIGKSKKKKKSRGFLASLKGGDA